MRVIGLRRGTSAAVLLLGLAAAATACGSSGSANPHTLLTKANQKVDSTDALHFAITSQNVHGGGTIITGGEGDIARPDQLKGTFQVSLNGSFVSVKIIAGSGKFFAEAPFQNAYQPTDPSTFGVGNPATLIDPNTGLSSLLVNIQNPKSAGQTRINGELLDKVTGTVPGTKIPTALPDAEPSEPVDVTALIDPSTREVRQFVLTGPFTSTANSTYTVTLTNYGEPVHIELPS